MVSLRLESAGCVPDFAPHQTLKPIAGSKLTLDERVHRAGTHRLGALEIDFDRIDARQRREARGHALHTLAARHASHLPREIGSLLPKDQRQRRTFYALCHILYPVSADQISIFRMDSNSTFYDLPRTSISFACQVGSAGHW